MGSHEQDNRHPFRVSRARTAFSKSRRQGNFRASAQGKPIYRWARSFGSDGIVMSSVPLGTGMNLGIGSRAEASKMLDPHRPDRAVGYVHPGCPYSTPPQQRMCLVYIATAKYSSQASQRCRNRWSLPIRETNRSNACRAARTSYAIPTHE